MIMIVNIEDGAGPNNAATRYFIVLELMRRRDAGPMRPAMSLNCLAVAPRRVIMHDSRSQRLSDRLDAAGITVLTCNYETVELGGGGLHCSKAPLIRDPI
jgi:arginine deiminase